MKYTILILLTATAVSQAATPYTYNSANGEVSSSDGVFGTLLFTGNLAPNLSLSSDVTSSIANQQFFFIPNVTSGGANAVNTLSYSFTPAPGFTVVDTPVWGSGGIFSTSDQNAIIGDDGPNGSTFTINPGPSATVTLNSAEFPAGQVEATLDAMSNLLTIETLPGSQIAYAIDDDIIALPGNESLINNSSDGSSFGTFFEIEDTTSLTYTATAGQTFSEHASLRLDFDVTAIPEPSSMALLGLGALGLIGRRKRA